MTFFRSYKDKTDEQLVVRVQRGDHHAFSELYNRYADRMNAYFYRMLWSDRVKAEDYVHDLFSKLIERPELYEAGRPVKPWLYQIASNMCKNAYRKKHFELAYLDQLDNDQSENSRVIARIDEQLIKDEIHILLSSMDEDRRMIFLLRYQQELSLEEISALTDIPIGTVKSRLFYVRKELLEALKEN